MKKDIIICGVGGQGILSIATIIGEAATKNGLYLKQAEVHGMSQRGGDVQSNLRLSIGSMLMMRSALAYGIKSEYITSVDKRKCDCTSPPRWLIPCTSACFR